jgi:hypothetical protein
MPTVNGVGKPGAGEPHARFDGRELETRHHRPWPPQWDDLPGNRRNTRLRDLPSIHVHAPAPDPTVWLYHRFPLSLREVQEMMAQRGVVVSHETVRQWCSKFGQTYANGLRRRRPCPGDKWHLDEVFIKINGKTHYLWRAVDQHGNVLDILVTSQRTPRPRPSFSASCSPGWSTRPGCWSPTS